MYEMKRNNSQGPLANTAGHFWLMVWEQNSRAILMLNRIVENRQVDFLDLTCLFNTDIYVFSSFLYLNDTIPMLELSILLTTALI